MGLPPSTPPDLRCPRCNAHVRHDAEWCTLCYADLRPAPEPVEVPPVPVEEPAVADDQGIEAVDAPASPHGRRRRAAPEGSGTLEGVDVDAMLAQLAVESDSGLGPLAGRLESKGTQAIVIAGGIGAICLVLFVVMAVLGALL